MSLTKTDKGSLAERLALRYLHTHQFQIIEQNVHLGKLAELDIVTQKDGVYHIIEVKSLYDSTAKRENLRFPFHNITPHKVRQLRRGTQLYCQKYNIQNDYTIDALGIIVNPRDKQSWVQFLPNILDGWD